MIHQHGCADRFLFRRSFFDAEGNVPAVPGFAFQRGGLPSFHFYVYGRVRRRLAHQRAILRSLERAGRKTKVGSVVADAQGNALQALSMGQLVRFRERGQAVHVAHRHGNAKPSAGSPRAAQGIRPAGRHLDDAARRQIPDGQRMYAAQEFFMQYGGFALSYGILVGMPRLVAGLGYASEEPVVYLRRQAEKRSMDRDGQAEQGLDRLRLVVAERSCRFRDRQSAGQGDVDVHGNERCGTRSGVFAGAGDKRGNGVNHSLRCWIDRHFISRLGMYLGMLLSVSRRESAAKSRQDAP